MNELLERAARAWEAGDDALSDRSRWGHEQARRLRALDVNTCVGRVVAAKVVADHRAWALGDIGRATPHPGHAGYRPVEPERWASRLELAQCDEEDLA